MEGIYQADLDSFWRVLAATLARQRLPDGRNGLRYADPSEFMFMGRSHRVEGVERVLWLGFKHRLTRNYIYLTLSGRLRVPRETFDANGEDLYFHRGDFGVPASWVREEIMMNELIRREKAREPLDMCGGPTTDSERIDGTARNAGACELPRGHGGRCEHLYWFGDGAT